MSGRSLPLVATRCTPAWTLHPPVDSYGDGYIWHLRTEIDADDLRAASTAAVGAPDCSGLPDFLDGLAHQWQGWQGPREWRSLDREVELVARHDQRRQVSLGVTLRRASRPYDEDAWTARVVLLIEPGEQMKQLARDVRALVSVSGVD
jgi:hypothetical protein